jgi:hypothetical protein
MAADSGRNPTARYHGENTVLWTRPLHVEVAQTANKIQIREAVETVQCPR